MKINEFTKKGLIRPLAVAIIRRGNKVLAVPCYDEVKDEHFYRLPGGGIEFGELAEETLHREFKEEIGIDLNIVKKVGVFENIFTFNGYHGHEIVIIYEATLPEKYDNQDKFAMIEDDYKGRFFEFVEISPDNKIYPEIFTK